jgi:alpha-glucosidase
MEQSKAGLRDNPENHLIIPFTRMIGGLVDYTPGGFNNVKREDFSPNMETRTTVMGTRAHHLAMYVVYESPFPMVSDWPEAYKNDPSFEFIKKVPSNWDKSLALNGYPGEYVTIARKEGDNWYIGAMTNHTPREYDISLDFLGPGVYKAEIYADARDSNKFPKKVNITTRTVHPGDKFKVNLATDGGLAVVFRKVQ